MKSSCLLIFLCSLLPGILGAAIREKRQSNQKQFVDELNNVRKQLAVAGNISNMWKLEWSDELVEKLHSLNVDNCMGMAPAYNYRFFYDGGNRDAMEYENGWVKFFASNANNKEVLKKALDELTPRTAFFLEKIHPAQSKVGCIPHNCKFDIDMADRYPAYTYHLKYKYICLIGPYGQFSRDDGTGKPGTRCGPFGQNEDGLCVESV
ncbi:hypothetical protein CRE_08809 [Caenorhabditis remanei]|uniref:Uncharacterized protein n=1 Tax=Caenorhabditis remanei TaxID=31234 RepID=E3LHN1_CAERE|nr:hypothetical protein CRE_08809 [Caenorhabditis remanei]